MESKQIDRRQFLTALLGGSVAGMFVMGSGSRGPAGSNANVGPGTTNKLAKFLSANTIGDSALSDDGSNLSSAEDILPSTNLARNLGSGSLGWSKLFADFIQSAGGTMKFQNSSAVRTVNIDSGNFYPNTDNAMNLGTSSFRWSNGRFWSNISIDNGGLDVKGSILPDANGAVSGTYSLGSSSFVWANVYCANYFGGANQITFDKGGNQISWDGGELYPQTDNARQLGTSGKRWSNLFALNLQSGSSDLIMTPNLAVKPDSDAAKDLGVSGTRWRDLYLSRRAIIASKNVLVLDGQSMTQSSHTVSNADTDIATYSLGANSYTRVIVRVTGYVSFATLSTNQSINLKIKDGTTQVGNTMVVDGALSANASISFTLEAVFVETSAVTIHLTEGAAAADANTTVFINSIIVLAES